MTEFSPAYEVRDIAVELIPKNHSHLAGLPIEFIFRSKAARKAGRVVLGTAKVVSGLTAYLSARKDEEFYLVTIALDEWEDMPLPKRRALVDHELQHCAGWDPETEKLRTRGHDVEEFTCVLERHGAWKEDLEVFARAAKQLTLPLLPEEVPSA